MAASPTSRTLEECRRLGWIAEVTEKYNSFTKKRKDLFGFIDVLAMTGDGFLGIQATSGDHVAHRMTKIKEECLLSALVFLDNGGQIEIWGWRKVKVKRGGKAVKWQVRRVPVTLDELDKTVSDCDK